MINPKDMALMFYVSDVKQKFGDASNEVLEQLAFEVSSLSLTIDITNPIEAYKKGDMQMAVKRAKGWNKKKEIVLLKANPNNSFDIVINNTEIKKNVSPLYLMALMTFCVNKVKGNLQDMQEFEYLNMGLALSGD